MARFYRFSILILLILLSACSPTVGPTLSPTVTPVRITTAPTVASTITPSPPENQPATAQAVLTQLSAGRSTATAKAEVSVDRQQTEQARIAVQTAQVEKTANRPTHVVATLVASGEEQIISNPSPDGKWQAEVIIYPYQPVYGPDDEYSYEQLRLVNLKNTEERVLTDLLIYRDGVGAYGLAVEYWSSDSRFLYYTDARQGVPDGGYCCWDPPLYRYDVLDGSRLDLHYGPLSPNDRIIAMRSDGELVLWDLDQGEIGRAPAVASGELIQSLAWSPDGTYILYLLTEGQPWEPGKSWLVRLDLPDLKQTILLEAEDPAFTGFDWQGGDALTLFDEDDDKWVYGLDSQELILLSPATPTPAPDLIPSATPGPTPTAFWFTPVPGETKCERPPGFGELAVFTNGPFFCIGWPDLFNNELGYRIILHYPNSGEIFAYETGPDVVQLIVPEDHAPRLDESQEQFMRRHVYEVRVYAIRPNIGAWQVGGTAMESDNLDFPSLPTATP